MKTEELQARMEEVAARIVGNVLRETGIRRLIFSIGQNLVETWAEGRPVREKITVPIRWLFTKGKGLKGRAATSKMSSDLGMLVSLWAQKINADHHNAPGLHAKSHTEAIRGFIEGTDFGEIAEMIQNSEECVVSTVDAFNEHLWRYPAKVASILSALLASLNTSVRVSREVMRPIEKNVAPDLLADMMLSLLKGTRGRDVGELTNTACELLRRLHTGSLLLGKAGKSLFQIYLTDLLQECMPAIKPEILGKARIALAEDREAVSHALADALNDNPGHVLSYVSSLGSVKNPSIRAASRKMRILEDIDHEGLSKAATEAGRDIDTYEIAGLVNSFFRIINRLHESSPDIFTATARSIADSIDTQEVRKIADWFIPEMIEAFGPVISEVMPSLMKAMCEMIDPEGRFGSHGHEEAYMQLKAVLGSSGSNI